MPQKKSIGAEAKFHKPNKAIQHIAHKKPKTKIFDEQTFPKNEIKKKQQTFCIDAHSYAYGFDF